MLVYIVSSIYEEERKNHIMEIGKLFPLLNHIEAIYPNKIKIPFYNHIKLISKKRTGKTISDGALGCLLSHRKAWSKFLLQKKFENCLILESDSHIENIDAINQLFAYTTDNFDIFFWGAFDTRVQLFKSTTTIVNGFKIGEPYINSLYCTYGYSINKKAASYLLKKTSKFNYPVDYWKYRLNRKELKVGSILPNLITTKYTFKSTIQIQNISIYKKIFDYIVDIKNMFITYFN